MPVPRGVHILLAAAIIAGLAMLLTARSLQSGFATDDHFARATFNGFPGIPEYENDAFNAFLFSRGDPEQNRALMNRGVFPWWTVPAARLAFWRPMATWSHYFDYRVWGDNPWPMHLENMLLYGLVCLFAALLYWRLMEPPWVAFFAALLFTIDENNGHAVGWLANRNMLMAAACVILILLIHDGWRRSGMKSCAVLGPLVLAFGFLCAEAVIAVGGYLLAYALFLDKGKWPHRLITLLPYGVVVIIWNVFYRSSGFGSAGSGWYTDPASNPVGFLGALSQHLPILLADLFLMWPSPLLNQFNAAQFPYIVALLGLVVVGILLLLVPMLKRDPVSRFWLLGLVLALVPVCAVTPQPRVVLIAGIGCAPLIARFLTAWATPRQWLGFAGVLAVLGLIAVTVGIPTLSFYTQAALIATTLLVIAVLLRFATARAEWMPHSKAWRIPAAVLAFLWVIFHGIAAPIAMPGSSMLLGVSAKKMERAYAAIPSAPEVADRTVVLLRAPTDFMPWHFALIRASLNIPYPGRMRVLSSGNRSVRVERVDERTLRLSADPNLIGNASTSVFRAPTVPMHPGDIVELDGMTVTVLAVDGKGMPAAAEYRFDLPLDHTSVDVITVADVPYKLVNINRYIQTETYVPISLPAEGSSAQLEELVEQSAVYQELNTRDAADDTRASES